jgi:hypothetical protein
MLTASVGRHGGLRQKLAAGVTMTEKRRTYHPRIVGDKVMMPADLEMLHQELLFDHIEHITDELRAVIEDLWPELVHKLPPKKPQS